MSTNIFICNWSSLDPATAEGHAFAEGPQLLQFAQRVSSDFHLKPLRLKTRLPIHRFSRQRGRLLRVPLFSDEACLRIAEASFGIPRMINILCDTALVYGFSTGALM